MRVPTDDTLFEWVTDFVCEKEFTSYDMVISGYRYPELVKTRRIVNAVLTDTFGWSQARIGRQWRQDHTTVGHALRTMTVDEAMVSQELGREFMEVLRDTQDGTVGHEVDGPSEVPG